MGDFVNRVWGTAKSAALDVGRGVADKVFVDGYTEAANTCVGLISQKIDRLMDQIRSGQDLSAKDQYLLSKLTDLRAETEDKLRAYLEAPEI
jgi:hypothetical protein